jgi:hypothetical protein
MIQPSGNASNPSEREASDAWKNPKQKEVKGHGNPADSKAMEHLISTRLGIIRQEAFKRISLFCGSNSEIDISCPFLWRNRFKLSFVVFFPLINFA